MFGLWRTEIPLYETKELKVLQKEFRTGQWMYEWKMLSSSQERSAFSQEKSLQSLTNALHTTNIHIPKKKH